MCYELIRRRMRRDFFKNCTLANRGPTPTSCAQTKHRFCTACPQVRTSRRDSLTHGSLQLTTARRWVRARLRRFQQQFDRAVGESADSADSASVSWIPHVDVREEAERFLVVADVPGVEGKDIEVTADKGVLTIRGERNSESKTSADGFERVERATGTFLRRFSLPESADAEAIKARHVNGVLEVSIPKRPQEQPRRISVQAA